MAMTAHLSTIIRTVSVLYVVLCAVILMPIEKFHDLWSVLSGVVLVAVIGIPAAMTFAAPRLIKTMLGRIAVLVITIVMAAFGLWVYYIVMKSTDAQSGIALIFTLAKQIGWSMVALVFVATFDLLYQASE